MATKALLLSYLNRLHFFLFIIFIHIGCFFISASPTTTQYQTRRNPTRTRIRKRKPYSSSSAGGSNTPSSFSSRLTRPKKLISSSWSFLKRTLLLSSSSAVPNPNPRWTGSHSSTLSQHPIKTTQAAADDVVGGDEDTTSTTSSSTPNLPIPVLPRKRRTGSRDFSSSAGSLALFPPLRNDIFPCPSCGEIFHRPHLLDHHRATHHALSELRDGDPGKNIVWIIFKTGWPDHNNNNVKLGSSSSSRCRVTVHRILKVHSSPRILSRFEDYRESVKAKADTVYGGGTNSNYYFAPCNERCLVDGNELLRFHCTTFVCGLGEDGGSSLCTHQCCTVCGIIRSGFSSKLVDDGISTTGTAWGAHLAVPGDVEAEFAFMGVKRAMLVCRVVAGRVGYGPAVVEENDCFDSAVVVGRDGGGGNSGNLGGGGKSAEVDEELVVFNPRAVLPCFVIVYSTC